VAQLGSALDWGSRGRRFKSCQPDVTTKDRSERIGPSSLLAFAKWAPPPRGWVNQPRTASVLAIPRLGTETRATTQAATMRPMRASAALTT
jgi:hypothetical protein